MWPGIWISLCRWKLSPIVHNTGRWLFEYDNGLIETNRSLDALTAEKAEAPGGDHGAGKIRSFIPDVSKDILIFKPKWSFQSCAHTYPIQQPLPFVEGILWYVLHYVRLLRFQRETSSTDFASSWRTIAIFPPWTSVEEAGTVISLWCA